MVDNEGELVVERTERLRRQEDQQLREAQDQAYQESLAADREKERLRVEDQSRAEELAREQERLQREQEKEAEVSLRDQE
jgi:FAS-associated factor 2